MKNKKYPHLQIETARGKKYYYVRLHRRGTRIRIKSEFGEALFLEEYCNAIKSLSSSLPVQPISRTSTESLTWLIHQYKQSSAWLVNLSESSRRMRDRYLFHIIEVSGDLPYKSITKAHIESTKEKRKGTPNTANTFIKVVRGLFKWAHEADYITHNPAQSVSKLKVVTFGHERWTDEEVYNFRQNYALGTRERLAFELLVHTGLRRSDVCRLGHQHIKNDILSIRCQKNKALVQIPLQQELLEAINSLPRTQLTLVSTLNGKPFTTESFGNFFGEACRKVGISKSCHGLRKYLATQLANSGSTERELKAWFGWANTKEAEVYVRNADTVKLAKSALSKLKQQA